MKRLLIIVAAIAALVGCKSRPAQQEQQQDPNVAAIEAMLRDVCPTPDTFSLSSCELVDSETLGDQIEDRIAYLQDEVERYAGDSFMAEYADRDRKLIAFLEGVREGGADLDAVVAKTYAVEFRYRSPLADVDIRGRALLRLNERGEVTAIKSSTDQSWKTLGGWFSIPGYEAAVMAD